MRSSTCADLVLVVLVAAFAFTGCDDAPQRPTGQPPAKPATGTNAAVSAGAAPGATDVKAGAETTSVSEYSYAPSGKRDPFRSFFEDSTSAASNVAPEGSSLEKCGPLCFWDIDQLRLVAVISGTTSPLAMVEDPDGRGHMLRRGSYIGKRSGKVSDIRRDGIVVTELIRRKDGPLIPAKAELRLKDKGGRATKDDAVDLSSPDGK